MVNKFNLAFIKDRRKELGLTNQQMATELGYRNGSTYHKYESGDYLFKAEKLPVLAKALNCSIEDFFKDKVAETAI